MQLPNTLTAARVARRAGRTALDHGDWEEAREEFERALKLEDTPDAHEGLATAAYFLEELDVVFAARERAFSQYRDRNERAAAARVAMQIVLDVFDYRPDSAVANGWLGRATRLLEEHETVAEHGMLALLRGQQALMADHDLARAREAATEALAIARRTRALDVEMMALALDGLTAVGGGDLTGGMALLDEATAMATSGKVKDLNLSATACCYLIRACDRVRDFACAAEWCERVAAFCRRWRFASMFAICRTYYASVLIAQGHWEHAEAELQAALGDFEALRPALAGSALTRLALLRVRQGRLEEAESLVDRAPSHRLEPLVRAELALARGEAATARTHAERYLAHSGETDRTERVAGLELLALATARTGDTAAAEAAAAELRETADRVNTDALHGAALSATGEAEADGGAAAARLREAVDAFDRAGMPWDAARARCALATVLAHEGATGEARRAANEATATFERLGSTRDLATARRLAGDPTRMIELRPQPAPATAASSPLNPRELEVLGGIAQGASDHEIADRLFLSQQTVQRHVANILVKLDVSSRAAAVAAATRQGLMG